jgi:t-SNARE complex subunit (syntaxin)
MSTVNSTQEFLRLKRQLNNDINALKIKPQQFNSLAARLKNNEPGASDEITPLVEETHQLRNKVQEKFRQFSDPMTNKFAPNSAQKRQETNSFKIEIQQALEAIKQAETNLLNSEKQAIQDYNNSRQLVNFDDDDTNPFGGSNFQSSSNNNHGSSIGDGMGNSNGNPFQTSNASNGGTRQTQASIQLDREMQERQKRMEDIEKDITNVNLIYKELDTLVYQQADLVDNIEAHIDTADVQVDEGIQQLSSAANYARSIRKKKLCLSMFCIAVIITIMLIIIISLKTSRD